MSNNISRIMIETVVRQYLRDIKDSPERSVRNLVDMALQFSNGRFQQHFFSTAQEMLKNEHSSYYGLARNIAEHVDQVHLLRFGMNLGYNSCTQGAKTIREKERCLGFNIPWAVSLQFGKWTGQQFHAAEQVLREGQTLGIYSWFLFAQGYVETALRLIREYPDHAFFLCCTPEDLTERVLEELEELRHAVPAVCYGIGAEEVCAKLRKRQMLYAVYAPYGMQEEAAILSGDLLESIQQLRPTMTILAPRKDCPPEVQRRVYEEVLAARKEQRYQTILWELVRDNELIDQIISDDACVARFDQKGHLAEHPELGSLFDRSLVEIFCHAFPKARPCDT